MVMVVRTGSSDPADRQGAADASRPSSPTITTTSTGDSNPPVSTATTSHSKTFYVIKRAASVSHPSAGAIKVSQRT